MNEVPSVEFSDVQTNGVSWKVVGPIPDTNIIRYLIVDGDGERAGYLTNNGMLFIKSKKTISGALEGSGEFYYSSRVFEDTDKDIHQAVRLTFLTLQTPILRKPKKKKKS